MKTKDKPRTHQDLLFELIKALGGQFGPLMLESFKQEVLPRLKRGPAWEKQLSEQEYQHWLTKIREELPAFQEFLLKADLPELPADWTASQN
jgi:hypothetical protein